MHHWQQRNPVVLEGLVQLMLGGPNHIYHGGLLARAACFYFDPRAQAARAAAGRGRAGRASIDADGFR